MYRGTIAYENMCVCVREFGGVRMFVHNIHAHIHTPKHSSHDL